MFHQSPVVSWMIASNERLLHEQEADRRRLHIADRPVSVGPGPLGRLVRWSRERLTISRAVRPSEVLDCVTCTA